MPDVTAPGLRSSLEKLHKIYELRVEAHRTVTGEADPLLEQFSGETGPGKVFQMSWCDAITRDDLSLEVINSKEYLYGIPKGDLTYRPIRFDREITHHTDARLYVFIVNPYSKQMKTAIHFIELLTDRTVMPDSWYSMHPQVNEPLENPSFSETLEQYIAEKDDCEKAIEQAEEYGLDSTSIQSHLDYYNACHASGDTIDFVSNLFQIGKREAALKFAEDFKIAYDPKKRPGRGRPISPEQRKEWEMRQLQKDFREWRAKALSDLNGDYRIITDRTKRFEPTDRNAPFPKPFVQAHNDRTLVEFYIGLLETAFQEMQIHLYLHDREAIAALHDRANGREKPRASVREKLDVKKQMVHNRHTEAPPANPQRAAI